MRKMHLSLVVCTLFASNMYAGKIVTDAIDPLNPILEQDKQFGFGGWNFDNVNVRIVNTSDFSGSVGTFYENNGTYTPMTEGMSFESDIFSDDSKNTIMAHLHGKDWPVGEPAGIKVINGDTKVQHGKPINCIMTTSYIEDHYLNVAPIDREPVICSSDFQTHKRFKINLLPTTVENVPAGGWGKPVDLVFNLDTSDTNTSIVRYQVLQKINNYTDRRLDGYSLEVLDENGNINSELTISLGYGEGDDGTDIWDESELANMSHGLWGPIDNHFPKPGFFDEYRAYYPVTFDSVDNHSVSYTGDMGASNYQEIFGNWLPSIWAPKGIFFDFDDNPATDADLVAFWGVPPNSSPDTALTWHKGFKENWAEPTEKELNEWLSNRLYAVDTVEDVLNLGLNYIVQIGDNGQIGSTFIIRIRPHVSTDQVAPAYVCRDNQHYAQGTLTCLENTIPEFEPPYLPDYIDGDRRVQGTSTIDKNATEETTVWKLQECDDGSLPPVQGDYGSCPQ